MPEPTPPGGRPKIEVEGSQLAPELDVLVEQVVVDDHLHLPDMFLVAFRDVEHDVLGKAKLKIGSRVKVSAPGAELLIDGEVTALEADYSAAGSRTLVRGYDGSHRLHRGRSTR